MLRNVLFCSLALTACGGSSNSGDDDDTPDAPAQNATVMMVACAGGEMEVETTGGFRFNPMSVTIAVGDAVKFTNSTSHSVVPATSGMTDPGLRAGFGTSTCLMFTEPGTFNYKCNPHSSMTGSVTVNP
jgi:plastocyanin